MRMKSKRLINKSADQVAIGNGEDHTDADDRVRRRIAEAAYARYEQRGREDGHALEDWLQAEAIVKNQHVVMP
jgi:hypothetical protein